MGVENRGKASTSLLLQARRLPREIYCKKIEPRSAWTFPGEPATFAALVIRVKTKEEEGCVAGVWDTPKVAVTSGGLLYIFK